MVSHFTPWATNSCPSAGPALPGILSDTEITTGQHIFI